MVRCSAMAQMLNNNFNITFVCISVPSSIKIELTYHRFKVLLIKAEEEFLGSIVPGSIIVLDGYSFGTDYQRLIKAKGAFLVCVDDLHDKEFYADIIINHAPGVKPEDYSAQPYTRFALGVDYALLRPAFLEQAQNPRFIDTIKTVFVCFGGADSTGLTLRTLEYLAPIKRLERIILVTGASFFGARELMKTQAKESRIDYRSKLDENHMLQAMCDAELAIVPASTILYEILSVRMPVITGYAADNQINIYNGISKLGLIKGIGSFNQTPDFEEIINDVFEDDPANIMDKQQKYFHGQSGQNISRLFEIL